MPTKMKLLKYKPLDRPKTSIIATVGGPGIYNKNYLYSLIIEGTNVIRINLAHVNDHSNPRSTSYQHIRQVIKDVKKISKDIEQPVGILFDICGPKIRVGDLSSAIKINPNDLITFTIREGFETLEKCTVTYSGFVKDVGHKDRIFLDDGRIRLEVVNKDERNGEITCRILSTSEEYISKGKGFNLPDTWVNEDSLTKTDMEILRTLSKKKIAEYADFLALSFVRDHNDIYSLKKFAKNFVKYHDPATNEEKIPVLVAKIETYQAVQSTPAGRYLVLDKIVKNFDGVMAARGDLAVETSPEDVPLIQLHLIKQSIKTGKPVIIATQMLVSMCKKGNERPTRPEANDVATAVLNYADAIMLSEETANGDNPSLCVRTMRNIALKVEKSQKNDRRFFEHLGLITTNGEWSPKTKDIFDINRRQQAIAESAILLADNLQSPVIVISTSSGDTALKISRYRPTQPIIAITDVEKSANKMLMYRGIYPFLVDKKPQSFEEIIDAAKTILEGIKINGRNLIQPRKGKKILVPLTLGIEPHIPFSASQPGNTNTIYLLEFS